MDDVAEQINATYAKSEMLTLINKWLCEMELLQQWKPAVIALKYGDYTLVDCKSRKSRRFKRRKAKQEELFQELARRGKVYLKQGGNQ